MRLEEDMSTFMRAEELECAEPVTATLLSGAGALAILDSGPGEPPPSLSRGAQTSNHPPWVLRVPVNFNELQLIREVATRAGW